jgi:hypothetical protein
MSTTTRINKIAREAFEALGAANAALLSLEAHLMDPADIPGIDADSFWELERDLMADRAIIERSKARAARIVRATNPKES